MKKESKIVSLKRVVRLGYRNQTFKNAPVIYLWGGNKLLNPVLFRYSLSNNQDGSMSPHHIFLFKRPPSHPLDHVITQLIWHNSRSRQLI